MELIPLSSPFLLVSAYRMARGQEATSTSQAGHRRGPSRDTPSKWRKLAMSKKIQRLLDIFEREWHHEILLTTKNLRELSRSPSPYIIPVIPRPLPVEIAEGEHYVIVDLLNLAPRSSSPAKNFETEAVGRELVISTQSRQPS